MGETVSKFTSKNRKMAWLTIALFTLALAGGALKGSPTTTVTAGSAPYGTYTTGPNGSLVATQTAYEVSDFYRPGLNAPEDLAYDASTHQFIVADTGNARVCVLDSSGTILESIDNGLSAPYGVSYDQSSYYVADRALGQILTFDKVSLALTKTIGKPSSPLFGKSSPFVPLKVNVNSKGIFVVSEGTTKGIIQLDLDGNFVGYVGANATPKSFQSWFQNLFFSPDQRASLLKAAPPSPSNLAFSESGLLYTVTTGDGSAAVKKLNTLGNIIMSPSYSLPKTVAIALDAEDNVFAATSEGQIAIYDGSGNLLFLFGERSDYAERIGNMQSPKALALLEGDVVAGLDGATGALVIYQPTDFVKLVFQAISYFNEGLYVEGEALWREILSLNSSFILSYRALAAADMKKGNYAEALREYELAQDRNGYSDAYWEVRNAWIQSNIGYVVFGLLLIVLLIWVGGLVYRRTAWLDKPSLALAKVKQWKVSKSLLFQGEFLRSPSDAVYKIKTGKGPSWLGATGLYVWYIVLQILNPLLTGYLFNSGNLYNTDAFQIVLFSTLPLFLWILANYFVAAVTDGEGKLKDIYVGTAYALTPYLLFALPIMIISRWLTFNESFVYWLLEGLMFGYCVILLFRNFSEVHDYSFWKTVKNLLLTLVAFVAFILACYAIYMIAAQLFTYLGEVIREVGQNV
jgi:Yip1 domain./NHL repeat.